ncbi:hypothetical protein AGABI2DRAFT_122713 [Agaricus bisporus var. bisporus H97]|uniref:hypothetical protein n=1 Tax=Agaricus bisporus var. bisporus (strain H97 / ATCC MYA-4626 / FGSC 10389) TaxID=936046 RepID=UPI00029F5ADD|nr:hypothetical protein AGABI2DRAFT_122713 [Agaricus bisporus var. bisporus H97]EKV42488.1 hypothetical protein AGABI2DRAFT_122713 [Agaricus bisporus var. bisporus H97]
MLQELLPARERPLHRFQNSRTHPSHRHPNPRLRTLPGHQRRHVSNGRPPLPRASSGSGQPLASTSATLSDTAIQTFNHLSKTSLKDFDLSDAYETLRVICGDRNCLPRLNQWELIWFLQKFCNKIESLYGDEHRGSHVDAWKVRFQEVLGWMKGIFSSKQIPKKQRKAYRRLVERSEALDTKIHYNIQSFNRLIKASVDDFSLDLALKVLSFLCSEPKLCRARWGLLSVLGKFCDKVEAFYGDEDLSFDLEVWGGHFRDILGQLEVVFAEEGSSKVQRNAFRLLVSRSRALMNDTDGAMELLLSVRATGQTAYHDTAVVKAYSSICGSIFHHHDAIHVMTYLDNHFFHEYFRPPFCLLFNAPDSPESVQNRHPRLLYILSTIRDPVSLFTRNLASRSSDWPQIGALLIVAYCTHKYPQLALRVHDAMVKSQLQVHHRLKLRIVRALAKGRYFDDAAALLSTISFNAAGYTSTAIHLFAMQGDTEETLKYYRDKRTNRNHQNNKSMLLFSYAYRGLVDNVRKLFDELYERDERGQYKNHKPTLLDYNVAIYAWARRGSPNGMSYWLDRMRVDGLKPGLHIYSSIIQSYVPRGDLTSIANVLDHIKKTGLKANAVIYTDIISALTRHYSPSMAEILFKRALEEGVEPDIIMVGSLLNSYVEAGHWDEAMSLFKSLEADTKSHLHLTIELYNMILKAYVVMGAPFRVVANLFEKLDDNPRVSPSPHTFALLLQSACDSGYMQAALDIFKEMEKRAKAGAKSLLNAYAFTILISGFLRKGDRERAMAIHEEMLNHGIKPTSVTFNTVLAYYSNKKSEQDLLLAHQFMTRVANAKEDIVPVEEVETRASPLQLVYEPVLRGYAASGKVDAFEKLLDELLDAGGQMTVPVLSSMMDLYRQKGRLDSAQKVWEHLVELGMETLKAVKFGNDNVTPTTDMLCYPLTIYLDMLCQAGEHEEVLNTWQQYRQLGFRFNFFNWNRLGTYLISAGKYEAAYEIMEHVILPYINVTLRMTEEISSSSSSSISSSSDESTTTPQEEEEEEEEEKKKPKFPSPFDILNKSDLHFLQSPIVVPDRPLRPTTRYHMIQDRHLKDRDDHHASSIALYQRPIDSDTIETAPVPEIISPLTKLSQLPGNSPRPHYTLLQYLLIGYQRLRAGQRAVPSVDPGGLGDVSYHDRVTEEEKEKSWEMLRRIDERYPNAVNAVLEFEEREKERMGGAFERIYIWS